MTILERETAVHFCNRFKQWGSFSVFLDQWKLPTVVRSEIVHHLLLGFRLNVNHSSRRGTDLKTVPCEYEKGHVVLSQIALIFGDCSHGDVWEAIARTVKAPCNCVVY